jgi:anti-sigma B factor antagonist
VLHGELDIATAPELVSMLCRMRRRGHAVVLDLDEVTFMDSTGLSALLDAYRESQSDGWAFSVRAASPAVWRVLELAGVGRMLGAP